MYLPWEFWIKIWEFHNIQIRNTWVSVKYGVLHSLRQSYFFLRELASIFLKNGEWKVRFQPHNTTKQDLNNSYSSNQLHSVHQLSQIHHSPSQGCFSPYFLFQFSRSLLVREWWTHVSLDLTWQDLLLIFKPILSIFVMQELIRVITAWFPLVVTSGVAWRPRSESLPMFKSLSSGQHHVTSTTKFSCVFKANFYRVFFPALIFHPDGYILLCS